MAKYGDILTWLWDNEGGVEYEGDEINLVTSKCMFV